MSEPYREKRDSDSSESAYQSWIHAASAGTYTPLSVDRIEEMFDATCKYGPSNCWTGATGNLATMVRELLRERESLLQALRSENAGA